MTEQQALYELRMMDLLLDLYDKQLNNGHPPNIAMYVALKTYTGLRDLYNGLDVTLTKELEND